MSTAPDAPDADPPVRRRAPALDGVRAVAVSLVLAFHGGISWAGGGFLGVDVFFVLSGYLITGLLIADLAERGHIGLKRFWVHRARRLLPALLALLVGIGLYAVFLAPPDTLGQLRTATLATLLYGNNWNQISSGAGYFAALATPSPLLHTWSLSIEEQFYLVWPPVVLLVMRGGRSLRTLLVVVTAGALASAVEMALIAGSPAGDNRAYYGTDTRAQALLVGAALAVVLARARGSALPGALGTSPSRNGWWQAAAGLLGGASLGVVLACAVTVGSQTTWLYRGGFAVVAVAAAGLLATVVLVPGGLWGRLLGLAPLRALGTVSYGLYLWHWPIFIVLDHARTGLTGWLLFGVRAGTSLAVATASYHLLEMPVRRGALRGWRTWALGPAAVALVAGLLLVLTPEATPALAAASVTSPTVPAPDIHVQDPGTSANTPSVAAGSGGPVRVLLVGDSEASFLGFGLGADAARYDVDFADDGVLGCGLLQGTTMLRNTVDLGTVGTRGSHLQVPCATQWTRWAADLATFHPDVVMLADGEYEVRNRLLDGRWTHIGQPAFDRQEYQAIEHAISVLRATGAEVVLLTAPYYHQPEQANGSGWPEDEPWRVRRYNALLRRAAAAAGPQVVVENLNAHLDPGGHYAQSIGGVDVRYADGIHVDTAGGTLVAPWLLTAVHALGEARRASLSGLPGR